MTGAEHCSEDHTWNVVVLGSNLQEVETISQSVFPLNLCLPIHSPSFSSLDLFLSFSYWLSYFLSLIPGTVAQHNALVAGNIYTHHLFDLPRTRQLSLSRQIYSPVLILIYLEHLRGG